MFVSSILSTVIFSSFADGVPPTMISISTLTSSHTVQVDSFFFPCFFITVSFEHQYTNSVNESALRAFHLTVNVHATVREYLIAFLMNLIISTPHSIQVQASSLAQFTQSTNELTRSTLVTPPATPSSASSPRSPSRRWSHTDVINCPLLCMPCECEFHSKMCDSLPEIFFNVPPIFSV